MNESRHRLVMVACTIGLATEPSPIPIHAQPNAAAVLQFDVASIKPSAPGDSGGGIRPGGATLSASNMPLIGLIGFAFDDIRPERIDGAPAWAFSQRYDIVAKSGGSTGEPRADMDRQRQMLQRLLAERFQLKFHHESKERQIYALVADKNGPKMKENDDLKSAPAPLIRFAGRGRAVAQIVSMPYMVQFLTNLLGETVVDRTGLTGNYDFTLEWAPDPALGPGRGAAGDAAPPLDGGPSLFTALREQLGLRLESTRGLVDFLVIDHVEQPSAN